MSARSIRLEFIVAALALFALPARAEDVIYGPDGAPTVVQRKLYGMTGRWEVGLAFDISLNTALVDQYGGVLGASYHPNESLDIGGEVLFHRTALSQLTLNVRNDLCGGRPDASCRPKGQPGAPGCPNCKDEFANDNQLRLAAFGNARWAPIYGKFNLAGEVSVHFQAFVLGGVGAGQVHRESVNLCADPGSSTCQNFQSGNQVRPAGELGAGFRFYLGQKFSLRSEVRAYLFPSSYKQNNDLTDPSSGNDKKYLASIFTFNAGLSLLF
jgi:outer membrane beta-barrel protein